MEVQRPLEADEFSTGTFARRGALSLEEFKGSGADWLEVFKPFIDDGETIVVSPHKVFGPQTNDLVLQLRKRNMRKVVLGGMLANMCVEAHLRDLLEQGFEVFVVSDATAGPRHPVWGDGYKAAMVNYAFLAHGVVSTTRWSRPWHSANRIAPRCATGGRPVAELTMPSESR